MEAGIVQRGHAGVEAVKKRLKKLETSLERWSRRQETTNSSTGRTIQKLRTLALILLQDQFLRSLYKGTPAAFSRDPYCLELSRKFLQRETHDHLKFSHAARLFIYLPIEHSENRDNQELSVQLFAQLEKDMLGGEEEATGKSWHRFAGLHKEVVDKFGRYPQRNKFLSRENTPEEEEWLNNLPDHYKW
ncbi:hypothetical protein ACROYT_G004349 [Oculina patagonica]